MKKTFIGWFCTAIFCGDWLHLYAPAPSPSLTYDPSSPWFSPSCFLPSSRTPHVLEFPRGLALEPVLLKTGFPYPVDSFRFYFSPVALILFVLRLFLFGGINSAGSFLAPELILKMLVCWVQVLVCCLHLVCWILVCCISFVGVNPLFCIFLFLRILRAFFALFNFFCGFLFFLRVTRGTTINLHVAGVVSLMCWRVDSHRGPVQELESAGPAIFLISHL